MRFRELQTVVLTRDVPEHGLKKGDVGAIVHVYATALEVEFLLGSGRTQAVVTLDEDALRAAGDEDVLAVRGIKAS